MNKRNPYHSLDDFNQVCYTGKHFTFFKFIEFIMKCAKLTFNGIQINSKSETLV